MAVRVWTGYACRARVIRWPATIQITLGNMKPRLFIASSVEGLDVAYAVQENLEYEFEVTVWPQGVFQLSKTAIASLISVMRSFDGAVFVFSPDDTAVIRGKEQPVVRDNVLFELGLFIGNLGPEKCFVLKPRTFSELHFPSDLLGLTPSSYDSDRSDRNMTAAVGPACYKIRKALQPVSAPSTPVQPHGPIETFIVTHPLRLFFTPPNRSKRMRFEPDGRIVEGNNRNEHAWRVVDDKLELLQLDGQVHSRFIFDTESQTFTHTNDSDTLSIRDQFIVVDRSQ